MLKMPTYNKNTHTKGKKKNYQTASLPLLFYPQTLQCPNTKQVSQRKNKQTHTNKQTKKERKKLKKKKSLAAAQQSATTSDPQHRREGLLVGKQFGQEQRPPRSAQSQRRYAQQRQ